MFTLGTEQCHLESCAPGRVTLGEQVCGEDPDKSSTNYLPAGEEVDVTLHSLSSCWAVEVL